MTLTNANNALLRHPDVKKCRMEFKKIPREEAVVLDLSGFLSST
jgi:hypothetical protein